MKKHFIVLAALTFIAAPSYASQSNELALQEQGTQMLKASLRAAQAQNWASACRKYKEFTAFKTRHGLWQFKPVTGSAKVQALIHEQNKLTAEANAMANSNGKKLCGNAGMAWTTISVPTSYSPTTSVSSNIRSFCEKKWGINYRMIKYCIDKQSAAASSLGY